MKSISSFTSEDVQIDEREEVYKGFFRLHRYRLRHRLFAGGWSDTMVRELFERGTAVSVLPYDPKRDELVLIEQFRIGAMQTSPSPWLYECVAGNIEPGEAPEEVCRREAQEEAGLELGRLYPMLSYLSSPGGTSERLYLYMAECDSSCAQGIYGVDEEHEDIRVVRMKSDDALKMLGEGQIDNAAAVISLQWFALHKQKVLDNWRK
ncbi:ADP-ribose diphosphatase [Lacimicrobium alkaliphilum]|uniref:ADP-ribose pyrophosphatase n=1 Tax=Lacimicrobium alkaliphilum TaxID=1526571 RepID=A0A0U3AXB3_9ALTE|nr:ADP-ribose diphosphatase [Lacimicrobium alkaliphilum]ALS97520.1 ADP-ribose pyrophosphatase [Lacimicrobium alkaliphilum]